MTKRSLRLKLDGFVTIQTALTAASKELGAPATLALADGEGVFLECQAGPFDALHPDHTRIVGADDVMWFASTTKLLTSICYLQLVDQGKLALDTDMRKHFPQLDTAASQIIKDFDDSGKPILEKNDAPVTLLELLNQTSGFGMEFGDKVPKWKKVASKGAGFVNSCKVDNLVNTPLCFAPGTAYEYGNSAEWLGLMLPTFVGMSAEEYFQKNLLQPLGMRNTSFYPDQPEWKDRLVPLRFKTDTGFEELKDQLPLLTLPRNRADIEYPVAGGGIYSTSSDYIRVLTHLLQHRLSLSGRARKPNTPLLSDASLDSLFAGTLPDAALDDIVKMFEFYFGPEEKFERGEANWSTGMSVYSPKDRRQRGGFGRHAGTVGWGGAAGTQYWIDEDSGIAVVYTTQVLPGSGPATKSFKDAMENAIYSALE